MSINRDSFILEQKDEIADFIAKISYDMYEYIQSKPESRFVMFYKYLTHSDLATFGKATKKDSHSKNLLYYIDEQEMKNIEDITGKPFQTAHQSCIGLKKELYRIVGLPDPRDDMPYSINEYMPVLLINQNLKYFTSQYTKRVFDKLNKVPTNRAAWNFPYLNVNLSADKFTPIDLHVAVHGLGMQQDIEFHKLRHHMFKGDTFILLFELSAQEKKMFILLEKNPAFFSIIGESNKAYEEYQHKVRSRQIRQAVLKDNAIDDLQRFDAVTRQQQSAWRRMLANEMMGYTQVNDQVFCPFTYITANFEQLGALFVASHIKGFSDKATTDEEKYDINNGLLLCANADALFDKHLITVNENKELIFSFLLDGDMVLKHQLLLLQPIFKPILNEKRMQYLAYHRRIFFEKEEQRKHD
ncbi:MAG: HNH endonuclease [Clostridiales bacterium]|nr:HNH endonuclease [Clostridiales bacterium]